MNRARVAEAMGVPRDQLLFAQSGAFGGCGGRRAGGLGRTAARRRRGDGVPGVALGVLTADCAPVLLADSAAGVIGAAHAGWRGALDGVIEATVEAMARLGARPRVDRGGGRADHQPARLRGRPGVHRALHRRRPRPWPLLRQRTRRDATISTCRAFVLSRLREAGVVEAGWIGACTCSDPERFFSYRRATRAGEPDYGRLISVIVL